MTSVEHEKITNDIASLQSSVKSAHKRIDELQVVIKAFYELASDVKVMVNEMTNMKQDISDIKSKVDLRDNESNKLMFNAKNAVITGVIASIIGALMALILK